MPNPNSDARQASRTAARPTVAIHGPAQWGRTQPTRVLSGRGRREPYVGWAVACRSERRARPGASSLTLNLALTLTLTLALTLAMAMIPTLTQARRFPRRHVCSAERTPSVAARLRPQPILWEEDYDASTASAASVQDDGVVHGAQDAAPHNDDGRVDGRTGSQAQAGHGVTRSCMHPLRHSHEHGAQSKSLEPPDLEPSRSPLV